MGELRYGGGISSRISFCVVYPGKGGGFGFCVSYPTNKNVERAILFPKCLWILNLQYPIRVEETCHILYCQGGLLQGFWGEQLLVMMTGSRRDITENNPTIRNRKSSVDGVKKRFYNYIDKQYTSIKQKVTVFREWETSKHQNWRQNKLLAGGK